MTHPISSSNPCRPLVALVALVALALGGATLAQQAPLPDAAQEALKQGHDAMSQALDSYDAQYPDRPLWQQAFRYGRQAQRLAPDSAEPLRFLAEAYSRANWYGPAWQAWLDYLARGNTLDADGTPLFTEVGSKLGYNYYQQGDKERAAEIYRRVIDEVPFDLEAYTWLGRILIELGQPQQAISYWQTVVERNPSDERAKYFLGLARDQAQWGVDAADAFRAGVDFYEQGDLLQARERFARATSLAPAYAEAWAWLGRVAFERGQYGDARSHYGEASRLAPDNQTYRYFYEESGRRLEGRTPAAPAAGSGGAGAGVR